jgi:hypothetical protein
MNHLHAKTSFPRQTLSNLVKPGQGSFLNLRAHLSIAPIPYHFTYVLRLISL